MYRYTRSHVFVIFMCQHITAVRALQFLISGARTTLPRKALLELLNLELEICGFVDWKQHLEKTTPFFGTSKLALRDHWSCNVATSILLHFLERFLWGLISCHLGLKSAGRMSSASQVPKGRGIREMEHPQILQEATRLLGSIMNPRNTVLYDGFLASLRESQPNWQILKTW